MEVIYINIKTLKEKEDYLLQAQSIYNEEFTEWQNRATGISILLNSLELSLDDNILINHFSYRYSDKMLININENFVIIRIKDFENDDMGYVKITIEDFISDNWKMIIKTKIENLVKVNMEKQLEEKKVKELAEYKRLQNIYGEQ